MLLSLLSVVSELENGSEKWLDTGIVFGRNRK